ncbi:unnamed protein product [Coffea canephora]|uniref:Uncharacterized protein n=1 Tax=Coffea canephora TaxID=49390 RepID=A0A068UWD6_COFCA|nr:unnamed protein product [Coffea canephora]
MGMDKIWYNQLHFLIELDNDVVVVYFGLYRKFHIPDGPESLHCLTFDYQEKFYFNLGDTGFKVI